MAINLYVEAKIVPIMVNTVTNNDDNDFVANQGVKYRRSKVSKVNQCAGKQNKQVCDNVNNQFVHVNRFQPLVSHIVNHIDKKCQSVVENTVVKGKRLVRKYLFL